MLKRGLIAITALGFIGCSAGDELGEEDAQVAWEATQQALNGGTSSGGPNALLGTKFDHECQDGGKAIFEYNVGGTSLTGIDIDASATSTSVDYDVKFKRCKVDGVTTTGDLTFSIKTSTSADGASTEWVYSGDLTYKGDLKGTCLIDMTGKASATSAGAGLEYSGSICGNDASVTLNASADGATVENNVDGQEL